MILSLFIGENITEENIEELKQHDVLDLALKSIGEKTAGIENHTDRRKRPVSCLQHPQ